MTNRRLTSVPLIALVVFTTFPGLASAADHVSSAPASSSSSSLRAADVVLASDGSLSGQIVNADGLPRADCEIQMLRHEQLVARCSTDQHGGFRLAVSQPGMYLLVVDGAPLVCRVWAPGTAPPAASNRILLVTDETVIRGHREKRGIYDMFERHPLLCYGTAAAIIAVPIAVIDYNQDAS